MGHQSTTQYALHKIRKQNIERKRCTLIVKDMSAGMGWKTPKDWHTQVLNFTYKKDDCKEYTNYRGLSFPIVFQKNCMLSALMACIIFVQIAAPWTNFHFEKSWKYANDVFACFIDLKKTYNRVSRHKFGRMLQEFRVNEQLLMAIKSLYRQLEVRVSVNAGKQSKSFHPGVGLQQG